MYAHGVSYRWLLAIMLAGGLAAAAGTSAHAQGADSTKVVRDSTGRRPAGGPLSPVGAPLAAPRSRFQAPITPRRAFLYSSLLPGLGQSKLDRGSSGALFAAVELSALVMLRRSSADLREARRYRADSLPSSFTVGSDGTVTGTGTFANRYDDDLIRTRRLHVEDWLAVVAFNHLFAGADAFVSAQLWDMPIRLSAAPAPHGPLFVATLRF